MSEALEDELKRRATHLGMSVSNLVRNILQHTVGLVEEIMEDGAKLTARMTRSQHPTPAPGSVFAWQEVVLNLNVVCERCNAILNRGSRAAIAVTDGAAPRSVLCLSCLGQLSDTGEKRQHATT